MTGECSRCQQRYTLSAEEVEGQERVRRVFGPELPLFATLTVCDDCLHAQKVESLTSLTLAMKIVGWMIDDSGLLP